MEILKTANNLMKNQSLTLLNPNLFQIPKVPWNQQITKL